MYIHKLDQLDFLSLSNMPRKSKKGAGVKDLIKKAASAVNDLAKKHNLVSKGLDAAAGYVKSKGYGRRKKRSRKGAGFLGDLGGMLGNKAGNFLGNMVGFGRRGRGAIQPPQYAPNMASPVILV